MAFKGRKGSFSNLYTNSLFTHVLITRSSRSNCLKSIKGARNIGTGIIPPHILTYIYLQLRSGARRRRAVGHRRYWLGIHDVSRGAPTPSRAIFYGAFGAYSIQSNVRAGS